MAALADAGAARSPASAFVLALLALVIAVYVTRAQLPSFDELKSSPNGQMIRVHAADGTVIVVAGAELRRMADLRPDPAGDARRDGRGRGPALPQPYRRRSDRHRALVRGARPAAAIGRRAARPSPSSSRATSSCQQPSNFGRKVREAILALALERKFTKDQILELYLNKVYFGGGAYGIDAAAPQILRPWRRPAEPGRSGDHRRPGQGAVAIIRRPPTSRPRVGRAGVVLEADGRKPARSPPPRPPRPIRKAVKLAPEPNQNSVRYFTDWALPQLDTLIDEPNRPLDVWTTLDLRHAARGRRRDPRQRAGRRAGRAGQPRPRRRGARDGRRQRLCHVDLQPRDAGACASRARRSSCSSISPRSRPGISPSDTVVDEPVTIDGWSPRNSSGRNSGQMTLRTAFAYSINTVAAQARARRSASRPIADMARRFGITTPINTHPSMVLGTSRRAPDRHDPRLRRGRATRAWR